MSIMRALQRPASSFASITGPGFDWAYWCPLPYSHSWSVTLGNVRGRFFIFIHITIRNFFFIFQIDIIQRFYPLLVPSITGRLPFGGVKPPYAVFAIVFLFQG